MNTLRSFVVAIAITLIVNPSTTIASQGEDETLIMTTSWYGPGMECYPQSDGSCVELMANGREFDMDDPTVAAHKELPFGTRLLLTNPTNGRSIIVTIQDRGPFIAGRDLDVSRGAAAQLGFIGTGVIDLQVVELD